MNQSVIRLPVSSLCLLALGAGISLGAKPVINEITLKGLSARSIGPAMMGGRVSDLAIDPKNSFTFYLGLATSGVWKTANNGSSFEPIFDDQPVQSIGAVAVAPSDSDVIWVGTGEGNDRNSSGWGNGVYVSTNAGGSWRHVGLTNSHAIRDIVVHPTNAAISCPAGKTARARAGSKARIRPKARCSQSGVASSPAKNSA